jgi:hypothetical protein
MKNFILCCALLCSPLAFAEDAGAFVIDAGTVEVELAVPAAVVDAGVILTPSLDEPLTSAHGFYMAVKTGNGWLAAMFMLFFFVGAIRIIGKRIHAMIPDDTKNKFLVPVEKVLYFIFDTKIGGWLLNWMSAIGGCLSSAAMAGVPVDSKAWKVAILASTGGTALIELKDDVMEWWDKKNADKAAATAEEAAKKVAVVTPAEAPPAEPPKP